MIRKEGNGGTRGIGGERTGPQIPGSAAAAGIASGPQFRRSRTGTTMDTTNDVNTRADAEPARPADRRRFLRMAGVAAAAGGTAAVLGTGTADAATTIDGGSAAARIDTILERRGTASAWATANPVLLAGEIGVETDTGRMKTGNGTSTWSTLTYADNYNPITI